jgi:choline kinase
MKVIIMAAGLGTRLKRKFGNVPKCCTEIGGESLIQRTIRLLHARGLHNVTVVTGYESERVRALIEPRFNVQYYHNPFYDITSSLASLWFARDELSGGKDIILMSADMFFEPRLLDQVLSAAAPVTLFADPIHREEAVYKLDYSNGILRAHGKELHFSETTGEYIGIAKLSQRIAPTFRRRLEAMLGLRKHHLWWEDALYELRGEGIPIAVQEILNCFWAELDFAEDYERVISYFEDHEKAEEKITSVSPFVA